MLSHLFMRPRVPQPRFAAGLFVGLVVVFGTLAEVRPVVGLTGLGAVAVLAAALVELNRRRIWEDYRRAYKRRKGLRGLWLEPRPTYYVINVAILWPFVALLGVLCLWAAYMVG